MLKVSQVVTLTDKVKIKRRTSKFGANFEILTSFFMSRTKLNFKMVDLKNSYPRADILLVVYSVCKNCCCHIWSNMTTYFQDITKNSFNDNWLWNHIKIYGRKIFYILLKNTLLKLLITIKAMWSNPTLFHREKCI